MSIKYPAHLFIRIDRPLRADLAAVAEARGVGVSEAARGLLRNALDRSRLPAGSASVAPEREAA